MSARGLPAQENSECGHIARGPACSRAGRACDLRDKEWRVAILRLHCRNEPLANEVALGEIAARTVGFSGASLQNLMKEAAITAARRSKDMITSDEIDYAIDRLTVGNFSIDFL